MLRQWRITGADLFGKDAPARPWLLKGYIPDGEPGTLSADGGTGKTTIAQQLGTCVAAGIPDFYGIPILRHGPVIFIAFEDKRLDVFAASSRHASATKGRRSMLPSAARSFPRRRRKRRFTIST